MLILNLWSQYSHDPLRAILVIAGLIIGILSAIAIHEFCHAWMATRLGDDTAERLGRLTLNPFAHIDPLGLFLFIVAGFGFGKPVPYDDRALKHETDEIKIALAGPASNLVVAIILALPFRIATLFGVDISPFPIFLLLDAIITVHIVLAVFNILPIPPLDGSKVLNYFLDYQARLAWARIGPIVLLFLVFSNAFFGGQLSLLGTIMNPLLRLANLIVRGSPQLF